MLSRSSPVATMYRLATVEHACQIVKNVPEDVDVGNVHMPGGSLSQERAVRSRFPSLTARTACGRDGLLAFGARLDTRLWGSRATTSSVEHHEGQPTVTFEEGWIGRDNRQWPAFPSPRATNRVEPCRCVRWPYRSGPSSRGTCWCSSQANGEAVRRWELRPVSPVLHRNRTTFITGVMGNPGSLSRLLKLLFL